MARGERVIFECSACGAQSPKWLGRCAECGAWGSLIESLARAASSAKRPAPQRAPLDLASVATEQVARISTGSAEFDRVLGGGLVPGSVVLLGGDPGIGKSTLLMQTLLALARQGQPALYVTGEESASQVALRAQRLGVARGAKLLATTELSEVQAVLEAERYAVVIVDSIQTVRSSELQSAPGSVAQLREAAARLTEQAKQSGAALVLIGHVTKDGSLAGPKVLEHLVDVVLAFEGDNSHAYRLVRGQKNRFGPTHEVGVFEMLAEGLREVPDPSALFLAERAVRAAGSAVVPTLAGSRPMLVEVQALLAPAQYGAPRRVVSGLDSNRLAVLLAVLQRKAGVHVLDCDVFAGVAGGARVDEPAADLGLCAAVVSALRERALPSALLAFGEVGLTGELRAVPRAAARVSEAKKHGFSQIVLPAASAERLSASERAGVTLLPAATLEAALGLLL